MRQSDLMQDMLSLGISGPMIASNLAGAVRAAIP